MAIHDVCHVRPIMGSNVSATVSASIASRLDAQPRLPPTVTTTTMPAANTMPNTTNNSAESVGARVWGPGRAVVQRANHAATAAKRKTLSTTP